MVRRWWSLFTVALACALLLGGARTASAAEELKFGTLAPRESKWGTVFKAWAKAVEQEGNGAVKLTWYWNGSQGTEADMVTKIRSGQLDGAAMTASGLSAVFPHYVVFQQPGLFGTWNRVEAAKQKAAKQPTPEESAHWAKLDKARAATRPLFDKAFDEAGFVILGDGDVGAAHLMSRGKPVVNPDDMKGMVPLHVDGDTVTKTVLEKVTGRSGHRKASVQMFLTALSSRDATAPNAITTPPLAADQLQWASQLDHISSHPTALAVGALVMSKGRMSALPEDVRKMIKRTGENAGKALTASIRAADLEAFGRLSQRMTVFTPNLAAWTPKFAEARAALKGPVIRADIWDAVNTAAQ